MRKPHKLLRFILSAALASLAAGLIVAAAALVLALIFTEWL